ncbi:MAG: zinc metallopeptidase [Opitutaceae bacterium]
MHVFFAFMNLGGGFLPSWGFLLLFIPVFLFALYAQMRVSKAYNKNARIPSRGGLTGREAAEAVMAQAGISDVSIEEIGGHLTDHYDPLNKRLCLSSENYRGTNLAALGVAAHESGHAIQHQIGYRMLTFRMALVPATQFVSRVIPFVFLISFFIIGRLTGMVLDVAIICYAVLTLFQLVTLPVEFDASRRAKVKLVELGILGRDERAGVDETLDAAALTYVAAFIGALLNLLYLLYQRDR